jgi:hypothetical protein
MTRLLQHQAVLDLDCVDAHDGATFRSRLSVKAPEVTVDLARWMEMGHPRQITITIHPGVRTDVDHGPLAAGPDCTCGPDKSTICHDMRNEAHFVGCPRWGTPLP